MKNLLYLSLALMVGCATGALKKKAASLNLGDSKEKILQVMGAPDDRQMNGLKEALSYCETGMASDDVTVIWLNDSRMVGMSSYKGHGVGSCTSSIKTIDWTQADATIDVRSR